MRISSAVKNKFSSLLDTVCREPYRLFFPLGIVMGTMGIGHWLWYALGWASAYSGFFHSSMQMLVYMNCFVSGFLLTALPRFSGTSHASRSEAGGFLFLLVGMTLFLSLGQWIAAQVCFLIWLVWLVRFALKRFTHRKASAQTGSAPRELIWIPFAVLNGFIGTGLLILGQLKILPLWSLRMGKPLMEQGFLLAIVMGIGGFLIPRIMGTYRAAASQPNPLFFHLLCGFGLFLSFGIEGQGRLSLAYGLRAFIVTAEFAWTGVLLNHPRISDFYIWLAWISVWMVALGFWGAAIWPLYSVVMLHAAFIGGFSLMTFAIAAMVIMTHAGEAERLHRPLWIFWLVAMGTALAVMQRAAVVMFPDDYFKFLGLAAGFWILTAVSWLIFMLPRLCRAPDGDEFERMHDRAKARLSSP